MRKVFFSLCCLSLLQGSLVSFAADLSYFPALYIPQASSTSLHFSTSINPTPDTEVKANHYIILSPEIENACLYPITNYEWSLEDHADFCSLLDNWYLNSDIALVTCTAGAEDVEVALTVTQSCLNMTGTDTAAVQLTFLGADEDCDCYCAGEICDQNSDACEESGACEEIYPGDCNDTDDTINPLASDDCSGVDRNCDGVIDQGSSTIGCDKIDNDGDGYCEVICVDEDGNGECDETCWDETLPGDCDETDAAISPGTLEESSALCEEGDTDCICNDELDNDCDGNTDKEDPDCAEYLATDHDDDGFCGGYTSEGVTTCSDGSLPGDCQPENEYAYPAITDAEGNVTPGATELCSNLIDDDCDGDEDIEDTDCPDDNRDDDGDEISENGGDCDDTNERVYPGATEFCDGILNNCNQTEIDEGVCNGLASRDDDGDGYCELLCEDEDGDGECDDECDDGSKLGDCNDNLDATSPEAKETCETGYDINCDGINLSADIQQCSGNLLENGATPSCTCDLAEQGKMNFSQIFVFLLMVLFPLSLAGILRFRNSRPNGSSLF